MYVLAAVIVAYSVTVFENGLLHAFSLYFEVVADEPILIVWPFGDWTGDLLLPSLSVFLPLGIFAMTVASGMILVAAEPLLRRPLGLILERAEASTKGVFTLAALGLAGIISILSAALRAF